MTNEPEFGLFFDEERIEQNKRVLQMHGYHKPLRDAGIIANDWGIYPNCGFGLSVAGNRQQGVMLYRVKSYDDFDKLFQSDSLPGDSGVQTIVLIPFEESMKRSLQDLKNAKNRLKTK